MEELKKQLNAAYHALQGFKKAKRELRKLDFDVVKQFLKNGIPINFNYDGNLKSFDYDSTAPINIKDKGAYTKKFIYSSFDLDIEMLDKEVYKLQKDIQKLVIQN
jgi:hypothetical protein